jgi:hypothetical protein
MPRTIFGLGVDNGRRGNHAPRSRAESWRAIVAAIHGRDFDVCWPTAFQQFICLIAPQSQIVLEEVLITACATIYNGI